MEVSHMSMILRIAAHFARSIAPPSTTPDTFDTQMAISQILLRSGWEKTSLGKIIKKTTSRYQMGPVVYMLDTLPNGKMVVKDSRQTVLVKVDLTTLKSPSDIMSAAKKLNSAAAKVN
jgi:hypothetical protein